MLKRISNHPVHIIDEGGKLSPSAFIPFCEFGGNMSAMGVKKDMFHIPICNSFKATIYYDQFCYEVDLENFNSKEHLEKDLKLGLAFFMDYNEDRQVSLNQFSDLEVYESLGSKFDGSNEFEHAIIYLNTIGKYLQLIHITRF